MTAPSTRSAFTRRRADTQPPRDDSARGLAALSGIVALISSATQEPGFCAVIGLMVVAGPGMCAVAELGLQ